MAKKQAITSITATETATPKKTAKPGIAKATPRVSSAKHSKSTAQEAAPVITPVISTLPENRHETISKIAYGYWIARGCKGDSAHEDWLRAEREYLSK